MNIKVLVLISLTYVVHAADLKDAKAATATFKNTMVEILNQIRHETNPTVFENARNPIEKALDAYYQTGQADSREILKTLVQFINNPPLAIGAYCKIPIAFVQKLIEHKIDFNTPLNDHGDTLLFLITPSGRPHNGIELILLKPKGPSFKQFKEQGKIPLLTFLLNQGRLNPNYQNTAGRTLVMHLIQDIFSSTSFIVAMNFLKALLETEEIDLSLKDKQNHDAFWYAGQKQHITTDERKALLELLNQYKQYGSPAQVAKLLEQFMVQDLQQSTLSQGKALQEVAGFLGTTPQVIQQTTTTSTTTSQQQQQTVPPIPSYPKELKLNDAQRKEKALLEIELAGIQKELDQLNEQLNKLNEQVVDAVARDEDTKTLEAQVKKLDNSIERLKGEESSMLLLLSEYIQ